MRVLFWAAAVVALAVCAASANDCDAGTACNMFGNGTACSIGQRATLRFGLQTTAENTYIDPNTFASTSLVTFPFCPKVDELQAFSLNLTAVWGAGVRAADGSVTGFSATTPNTTIGVFGMGGLPDQGMPKPADYGSALFYQNVSRCSLDGGATPGPALVSFLILNLTLTNGEYYYIPEDSLLPVQSGFVPTCNSGTCELDNGDFCIGTGAVQNCARCVKTFDQLQNWQLTIWTAYYGTDASGRRLLSGGNNPMNFRQFATDSLFNTIKSDVENL